MDSDERDVNGKGRRHYIHRQHCPLLVNTADFRGTPSSLPTVVIRNPLSSDLSLAFFAHLPHSATNSPLTVTLTFPLPRTL
jgi:hypothetical protein